MKSQGEIEAAVAEGVSRFQSEFLGRGPRDIHCHLLGSLLVVRLQGALTPAERQLLVPRSHGMPVGSGDGNGNGHSNGDGHPATTATLPVHDDGNGRALLKQVRTHMVANGRGQLGRIVEEAVGVRLVSVHHDISTVTGEEVLVFSLADTPECRARKRG